MKQAFFLLGATILFLMIVYTQQDLYAQLTIRDRLQQVVAKAAHDASLQIQTDLKSEGMIVFDQSKAHDAIVNGFAKNFRLNEDLTPQPGSMLSSKIEIMTEDYIDEQSVTFPYEYQKGSFQTTLTQPSIVLTVRTAASGKSPFSFRGYLYAYVIVGYGGIN